MAYQVLARKYRPQRFSDVVGQDHVTRTLMNALAQGRIAHGYIFSGHRGIGKTTIARIVAMALNCRTAIGEPLRPSPEPCGICESCTEVRAGNAVDVIEIDAATNRGIDEIRELRDAARYRPARDRYKIYILDEAHQITDAAFNALLKTLEEPPDHVIFMMATTQPEDIPQTIRSRCQHFSFHAVKFDDILLQLRTIAKEESITADDDSLALLAEAGDGSMRDALSIMDQAIASAPLVDGRAAVDAAQIRELMGAVPNTVFERLLEAVSENQSGPVIEEINRLLNAGNSASQLARQFVRYLRNVLMARIAGEASELLQLSPDERARAGRSALLFSEEDLTRFLQVMLRTFDELNYRQEPRFHLELGLVKLVHLQRLLPVEQLLSQLGGAAGLGAAPRLGGGPLPSIQGGARRSGGPSAPSSTSTADAPGRPQASPAAGHATAAETPAFSPFQADSRRKGGDSPRHEVAGSAPGSAPPASATAVNATTDAPSQPSSLPPAPASSSIPQPAELPSRVDTIDKAVAEDHASGPPSPPSHDNEELSLARERVVQALEQAGHNTAAALLANANWLEEEGAIRVEVAAKNTMLSLTMNPEAERICRDTMRMLTNGNRARALRFVSASSTTQGIATASPRVGAAPTPLGSVQARAMENPLVKQAQELFRAEVRSVVDLRNK